MTLLQTLFRWQDAAMAGDELSLALFYVGLGVSFVLAAISQAGWRGQAVVGILWALAALSFATSIAWPFLGAHLPKVSAALGTVASSPVAWFCALLLSVSASFFIKTHAHFATPSRARTSMQIKFYEGNVLPTSPKRRNVEWWYAHQSTFAVTVNEPDGTSRQLRPARMWVIFLLLAKPVAASHWVVSSNNSLPQHEVKQSSHRHVILSFAGELENVELQITAMFS